MAVEARPAQSLAWVTSAAAPAEHQGAWLQQQSLLLLCGADVATQVHITSGKVLCQAGPQSLALVTSLVGKQPAWLHQVCLLRCQGVQCAASRSPQPRQRQHTPQPPLQ